MAVDVRRELKYIWNQYEKYWDVIGEEVIWFQFDTVNSRWDDVYDETGASFRPGIRIPILWVDQIEDPEQYSGEGRRPTMRIRFAISTRTMRARGITTLDAHGGGTFGVVPDPPEPAQIGRDETAWLDDRLNDVIFYDGRYFAVSNYQIRGRTPQGEVILGIAGLEMQMDEFDKDNFPWETPLAPPLVPAEDPSTLDLELSRSAPSSLRITIGTDDLTGSEWVAVITDASGATLVTLTVDSSEQATGVLTIPVTSAQLQGLLYSKTRYTWSLTQVFDGEGHKVLAGKVEVVI